MVKGERQPALRMAQGKLRNDQILQVGNDRDKFIQEDVHCGERMRPLKWESKMQEKSRRNQTPGPFQRVRTPGGNKVKLTEPGGNEILVIMIQFNSQAKGDFGGDTFRASKRPARAKSGKGKREFEGGRQSEGPRLDQSNYL